MRNESSWLATLGLKSLDLEIDGSSSSQISIADLFFDTIGAGALASLGYDSSQLYSVSDEGIEDLCKITGELVDTPCTYMSNYILTLFNTF